MLMWAWFKKKKKTDETVVLREMLIWQKKINSQEEKLIIWLC